MPIGGALKLKGGLPTKDKKKKKKKRDREEYEEQQHAAEGSTVTEGGGAAASGGESNEEAAAAAAAASAPKDDGLTETQRRHREKMKEREKAQIKKLLQKTHRERIDEFNQYLSVLTEHNDIPRVSAAGNG